MGRRHSNFVSLIAPFVILVLGSGLAGAQPHGQQGKAGRVGAPHRAPNINGPRERFMALPPQDRQIFQRNAERWMQMGPEERMIMREREKVYRARLSKEVDAALRDSGLHLEGEKRAQFEQRYLQERRRIEHSLREEVENKRQQELPGIQERLKKEFSEPSPSGTSVAAPAASTSPKK
ncbi:MAG TPA: hypothetical protein VG103_08200 [Chthoniobacterales bacterium]|nr:hypothetical protein [Chthoniobacterales bacterium]